MKKYQKPELLAQRLELKSSIANLANWLENGDGKDYKGAGITTYVLES